MQNDAKPGLPMSALVLSPDVRFLASAFDVMNELQVTPRIVADRDIASGLLERYEFDAIIVDWREIEHLESFLSLGRKSKLNREAVLVAIAREALDMREAFAAGVHLLIHKPASVLQIERCLRAAYGASIVRKSQLHREPLDSPALLSAGGLPSIEVTMANLSAGGARVKVGHESSVPFKELSIGTEINLDFALPEIDNEFHCRGMVIWSSAAGDAGLRFSYIPDHGRQILKQWLTEGVERSRAEHCARLRACA
jgi:hypothetical protein